MRARIIKCLANASACFGLGLVVAAARAQTFRYEAEPRAGDLQLSYATDHAPPRMLAPEVRPARLDHDVWQYRDPRDHRRAIPHASRRSSRRRHGNVLLTAAGEPIPPGSPVEPFVEDVPPGPPGSGYGEYYDGDYYPGEPAIEPFLDGPPCGGCGQCQDCDPCGPCYMKRWGHCLGRAAKGGAFTENLQLISGKQGFKGPVDQGLNGNFGYHFAFNWGLPLIDSLGVGAQVSGNLVLSDFEGRSSPLGHRRSQFFVTAGAFRRVAGSQGFQGGLVGDYLHDRFYVFMDLWQLRGQVSYVYHQHEVGFWGTVSTESSTAQTTLFPNRPNETFIFQGTDQFNLFYRYQFCNGTFCRTWAGVTSHADGIFGGDATARISPRWGLIAAYNYLLPRNSLDTPNNVTESWNLTISFVWYPFYKWRDSWLNPYRPLFYAADNGWFMVRQKN